ncbi:hypothetical protein BDF19DRAFT_449209 [Syncephalis fuscata]|nr:hypothetical protein BDF19DRAFT_449209 [Syncephalis fuscata]
MNISPSAARIVETGDRVRILVLGDRGVGKSSLIHMLCHHEPLRDARATIGFHVDVKVYEHKRKRCWIELLEVAGAGKHPMARRCLYAQKKVDGVILVHDPSNRRSYQHLWRWMSEATQAGAFGNSNSSSGGVSASHENTISVVSTASTASPVLNTSTSNPYAMNRGSLQARRRAHSGADVEVRITTETGISAPVLLVGTMADRLESTMNHGNNSSCGNHPNGGGNARPRRYSIVEEFDGDVVQLCSVAPSHFVNGSPVVDRLNQFFDKVIDNKFFRRTTLQSPRMNPSLNSPPPPLLPSVSPPLSPRMMPYYPNKMNPSYGQAPALPTSYADYAMAANNQPSNSGLFPRRSPILSTANANPPASFSTLASGSLASNTALATGGGSGTVGGNSASSNTPSGLSNLFSNNASANTNIAINSGHYELPREKRPRMAGVNTGPNAMAGYAPGGALWEE